MVAVDAAGALFRDDGSFVTVITIVAIDVIAVSPPLTNCNNLFRSGKIVGIFCYVHAQAHKSTEIQIKTL